MITNSDLIHKIKDTIKSIAPKATVILYGSFARGDNRFDSDLDVLILLDKDKITREDEKSISYPLYDIEFDTGQVISPLVLSKSDWEKRHRITPFYENIKKDGVVL
jgi:predicted nucleotidyltransferase